MPPATPNDPHARTMPVGPRSSTPRVASRGTPAAGWGACVAAGLLLGLTGCVIHPKGPHGAACPVIEDASYIIEYPSERLRILKSVAVREDLSAHEQIYLVNAVMAVGFSSDKAQALVTLIRNPCCTADTRQHIRKMLKLSRMLGHDQRRVIDALERAERAATRPAS